MSKMQVITVDSASLRNEVAAMNNSASSLYHDWDSLGTNVSMPAFKALRNKLNDLKPRDSNETLHAEYAEPLFKTLEQWAYRYKEGDTYGIYAAHLAMIEVGRTEEAKRAFVEKCAVIKKGDDEIWDHNQAEVLVGKALLDIMNGKTPQEIKDNCTEALENYTAVSTEQVRKDIARPGKLMLDSDGVVTAIKEGAAKKDSSYSNFRPENFPELTREQIGFLKQTWGQGKFDGGWATSLIFSAMSNGLMINNGSELSDKIPSNCFIKHITEKNGEKKTYVIMSKKLQESILNPNPDAADSVIHIDQAIYTVITDISALQGKDFTIGCASAEMPMRFIIEAPEEVMKAFAIPTSLIKTGIYPEDEKILKEASIAIPKASTREMDKRWIDAKAKQCSNEIDKFHEKQGLALTNKSKTPEEAEKERAEFYSEKTTEVITDYLLKKLNPNTKVGSELQGQMKEDITALLGAIPMTSAQRKDAKNVTTLLVRDCAQIASKEDPTIKLTFGQRIRHAVIDSLKSFFSLNKEQKKFKDIIGKDFAHKLQEHLNHQAAPSAPTPRGSITKRGSGIEV